MLNNVVVVFVAFSGTISKDSAYKELLTFKILIRRMSQILFFKVMFTLKRVEVQLNPEYESEMQVYGALKKLMCLERIYLLIISILLINIGFLIVMFVENDYSKFMQKVYETSVISISPFFWICNIFLIFYFYRMGKAYLNSVGVTRSVT